MRDLRSGDKHRRTPALGLITWMSLSYMILTATASWFTAGTYGAGGLVHRPLLDCGGTCVLSILIVVYNKAHYLNRSFGSLLSLRLDLSSCRVVFVDDCSTDSSVSVIKRFAELGPCVHLIQNEKNIGSHSTRIRAVLLTETPFLTFLDPDDEFSGPGLGQALSLVWSNRYDIIEFGCVAWCKERGAVSACGPTPSISRATPGQYREAFFAGAVSCRVHGKIIRTEVYKKAIGAMPMRLVQQRINQGGDKLQYSFIVHHLTEGYIYIHALGEVYYADLPDNSRTATYHSLGAGSGQLRFVNDVIYATFGRHAK